MPRPRWRAAWLLALAGLALGGAGCRTAWRPAPPCPVAAPALAWTRSSALAEGATVAAPTGPLRVGPGVFVDELGRSVLVRGMNVSGLGKLPASGAAPPGQGWFEPSGSASFVGRPLPLAEARGHFSRIASWGFHTIRLLVPWEAVEGRAPGLYDQAYLDSLRALAGLADEAGLRVVVDFHQDVWSRFTGGDGAPRWTLEEAGFDVNRLRDSGAALFACQYADQKRGVPWLANHERLACATLFTLFFAGDDFAPGRRARDGSSLQRFLQDHYLAAAERVARTLRPCRNVVGFGLMNEPAAGFIGRSELQETGVFALDRAPTPLQAFAAGCGVPQSVADHHLTAIGPIPTGRARLNVPGVRAWRDGIDCVWKEHGVWGFDRCGRPRVLSPRYFSELRGRPVDFRNDYYKPFIERFTARIHGVAPRLLVLIEEPILPEHPEQTGMPDWAGRAPPGVVDASHWYDIATLATSCSRSWLAVDPRQRTLVVGRGAVGRFIDRHLAARVEESRHRLGWRPVVVGEFGIPFPQPGATKPGPRDISGREAALGRYFEAFERARLGHMLWQYGPGSVAAGDGWNHEDFAIHRTGGAGDRALAAVIRPYALAVPGALLESGYDATTGVFRCRFRRSGNLPAPALIFLPEAVYGTDFEIGTNGGSLRFDRRTRLLALQPPAGAAEPIVVVRPAPGSRN